MIGRQDVVQSLIDFLESHGEFEEASSVVFGSDADSSSIVTYFALDAHNRFPHLKVRGMGEALLEGKPILFVDDILGSGRQAAAIVRAWFGDRALAEELGEGRQTLPPEVQSLLRVNTLGFCFGGGLMGGTEQLGAALDESDIGDAEIHVGQGEDGLPTIFNSGKLEAPTRTALIERCKAIGEGLLGIQEPQKRKERALGYRKKGLLITFPYNIPSQTLTCLWQRGIFGTRPWTPPLPRRRKN